MQIRPGVGHDLQLDSFSSQVIEQQLGTGSPLSVDTTFQSSKNIKAQNKENIKLFFKIHISRWMKFVLSISNACGWTCGVYVVFNPEKDFFNCLNENIQLKQQKKKKKKKLIWRTKITDRNSDVQLAILRCHILTISVYFMSIT